MDKKKNFALSPFLMIKFLESLFICFNFIFLTKKQRNFYTPQIFLFNFLDTQKLIQEVFYLWEKKTFSQKNHLIKFYLLIYFIFFPLKNQKTLPKSQIFQIDLFFISLLNNFSKTRSKEIYFPSKQYQSQNC